MKPGRHGTYVRYHNGPDAQDQPGHGCRCRPCRDAHSDYMRLRRRLIAYQQWTHKWGSSEPVRAHLGDLMAAGTSGIHIARASGVGLATVHRIVRGHTDRISPRVARALLAVTAAPRWASHIGIQRRARGLARLGYTLAAQADMLGVAYETYTTAIRLTTKWPARQGAAVAAMYDRLMWAPPPTGWKADRSRRQAAARGWHSPAAWDDDTIDDPNAEPAGIRTTQHRRSRDDEPDLEARDMAMAGQLAWADLNPADRGSLVARLLANGWAASRIARRFGLSGTTVAALVAKAREATVDDQQQEATAA